MTGWQRTLWLMVGVQTTMSIAFQISAPFLPLFLIQLGVHPLPAGELWAGAISSVNFLTSALLSPIWGGLADRVGRKAMVIRSTGAVALFTALMGLVQNAAQLFGVRALMGAFSGFSAAATALVATKVPQGRLGFSLGWMATGQLVGALVGPLLGGYVADQTHDYRVIFFGTSIGAFIAAVGCTLFVHEGFERGRRDSQRPTFFAELMELVRHPQLAPMFVIVLLAQVAALGVQPIVPLYVRSMVGNAPWLATAAGASFAVTGLADLIASPLLGKRSDRIGYRRVLLISLAGVAAFTIPQAFVHSIWGFIALRFGVGIFLGGILPTANAWIGSLFPGEQRGRVYGVVSSATFMGMFVGPLLGGGVASKFGFEAAFVIIGSLTFANFLWVLFAVPYSRHATPSH